MDFRQTEAENTASITTIFSQSWVTSSRNSFWMKNGKTRQKTPW